MKRKILSAILSVVMVISLVPALSLTASATNYVSVTYAGQVVDSITYRGQTINAVYAPYNSISNYGSNGTYNCTALVVRFYQAIYGISVSNMWGPSYNPQASSGSFTRVASPKKGDIVRFNNETHWALVKEVNGNNVTLIQQNAWNSITASQRTSAQVGRIISASDSSYAFFRYSGYLEDSSGSYYLDLNGNIDLEGKDDIRGYGTADVYINGSLAEASCGDYWTQWPSGTRYEIKNIKAASGYMFTGLHENSAPLSGTVGSGDPRVTLSFMREKPTVSVTDGLYRIVYAYDESKALDVNGGTDKQGENIQLYDKNDTDAQIFRITRTGQYYKIINEASGMAVDVTGGSCESGVNVQQYTQNTTDAQKWRFLDAGDGSIYIQSAVGTVLDVTGGGNISGTNVETYYLNETPAQKWKLVPYEEQAPAKTPTPSNGQTITPGRYMLVNTGSGYTMNYASSGWRGLSYKPICMSYDDGSQEQVFDLQYSGNGQYTIAITHSDGGAVNVWRSSGSVQAGDPITQSSNSGSQYQKFYITSVDGGYILQSASDTNKVIATPTNDWHALLQIADYNASDSKQIWKLTSTTPSISVTGVRLNKTSLSLTEGTSETLTATVLPTDATDKSVTWNSSNTGVATVSGGKVTAVKAGTATITATAGGKSASCTVTVKAATVPVRSISLNNTTLALAVGDSANLIATVNPSNATDKTVTWSSSNTGIATVSNGKVTAVAKGSATITASAGGKTASCVVTVSEKVIPATSVTLSTSSLSLTVGESETLTATVAPSDATDKNVTWVSNDPSVATVSGGRVTAVKAGTATITATCGSVSASCSVTVKEKLVAPTITTENLTSGAVGKSYQATLTATGTTPISWSISSGALPDGLALDASTGAISGTPTKAGSFGFTVTAKNSAGEAQKSFSMTVSETSVTLSFETNGGSAFQSVSCAKGSVVYLSNYATTREGYDFTGWYSDAALTTLVSQLMVNADTTFYAGWKEKPAQPTGGSDVHFEKATIYYQDQFTDVPANQWYTDSVAGAFEYGLMKGNSDTTFNPYGDVTIAEAVTMAARIYSIYMTGTENFDQSVGGAWYQVYLDYALENGIISSAYYNSDVSNKATRAQFAEIFARSLPAEALAAINSVADGAVPDVAMSADYAEFVYLLYRAGILTGSDANGTFHPATYITRAEAAAIVSRMAESNNRVSVTLG